MVWLPLEVIMNQRTVCGILAALACVVAVPVHADELSDALVGVDPRNRDSGVGIAVGQYVQEQTAEPTPEEDQLVIPRLSNGLPDLERTPTDSTSSDNTDEVNPKPSEDAWSTSTRLLPPDTSSQHPGVWYEQDLRNPSSR